MTGSTSGSTTGATEFRAERDRQKRWPIPGVTGGERVDDGLFGPDSVTWHVWSKPTVFPAAYRATVVQMLLPPIATGVNRFSSYASDVIGRLRRTGHYFAAVALGDTRTATETARFVNDLHRRVHAVEPSSGREFTANDADLATYVHVTAWHSALATYERYYGPLSAADRARYYEESKRGSNLVGVREANAPGTHDEVRDYFAGIDPHLAVNEDARTVLEWFDHPPVTTEMLPLLPAWYLLKHLALPTIPRRLRRWMNIDQPLLYTAASLPVGVVAVRLLEAPAMQGLVRSMAPEAAGIQRSALRRMREFQRATR